MAKNIAGHGILSMVMPAVNGSLSGRAAVSTAPQAARSHSPPPTDASRSTCLFSKEPYVHMQAHENPKQFPKMDPLDQPLPESGPE